MTPKPTNLPPVDQMTPEQIMLEAARLLHNAGGEKYGARHSMEIAVALKRLASEA